MIESGILAFQCRVVQIHSKESYRHFKNKIIKYNLKDLDYTSDFYSVYEKDGMELLLPLNLAILKEVGYRAKWCVTNTSYEEKVISGKCAIMFIKEKEDITGCIELVDNFSKLIQAKSKRNKELNNNQIKFLQEFCIDNDILVSTEDMLSNEFQEVI